MSYEYMNLRRVSYGDTSEGWWVFVPVCPKCGKFVKADKSIRVNGLGLRAEEPNATCKKCGRVEMPCEGCL